MKHAVTFALAALLVACSTDQVAPASEALNAKGGTPADPPCDTYKDDVSAIEDCALLKLAHPDSLTCWNSTENYRRALGAWETRWAELECDVFE